MHEIAKAIDHPGTIAMSYLNIGTELERMGKQEDMQEEIKSRMALEANIWLDAWIPP
jgi:hypothetical protein